MIFIKMENIISLELTTKLNKFRILDNLETNCVYHNIETESVWMWGDWYEVIWISNEIVLEDTEEAMNYLNEVTKLKNRYSKRFDEKEYSKQYDSLKRNILDWTKEEFIQSYRNKYEANAKKFEWELIFLKTLTKNEVIEFLKEHTSDENGYQKIWDAYTKTGWKWGSVIEMFFELNNIETLEKIINYLLENNLLIVKK